MGVSIIEDIVRHCESFDFNVRHSLKYYGGGGIGVNVSVGVSVGGNVLVGVIGVNVSVGGEVFVGGGGVLVGDATTIETVSVDPNGVPVWVPKRQVAVYLPGCFGAVRLTET